MYLCLVIKVSLAPTTDNTYERASDNLEFSEFSLAKLTKVSRPVLYPSIHFLFFPASIIVLIDLSLSNLHKEVELVTNELATLVITEVTLA